MRVPWPAVLLAAACAGAPARAPVVQVETEGWAPLERRDAASARARAVEDALKRAVEQASGVDVGARVKVRNGRVSDSAMTSRASGRVESYSIVSEGPVLGAWRARVRARVVRDDRPAAPALAPGALHITGARAAVDALNGALLGKGWELSTSSSAIRIVADATLLSADDPRLAPMRGRRATVSARALSSEGETIWSSRAEAAALAEDLADADAQATELAARRLAEDADKTLRKALWDR